MKKLIKEICYPYVELLEAIDRWLCVNLFHWRLRLWWQQLFYRQEIWCTNYESDVSLSLDPVVIQKLDWLRDIGRYRHSLEQRRIKAYYLAQGLIPKR